jgi:biopolymer transport protein ExbD
MRSFLPQSLRNRRTPSKRNPRYCKIDSSGLAHSMLGLVLPLFLVVMMTSDFPGHHRTAVDLAGVFHPIPMRGAMRDDAIRIAITKDGSVYFRNQKTVSDELRGLISERLHDGSEKKVYLDVDSRTRYSELESVLDGVRAAGIHNIALLTEARQSPNSR